MDEQKNKKLFLIILNLEEKVISAEEELRLLKNQAQEIEERNGSEKISLEEEIPRLNGG